MKVLRGLYAITDERLTPAATLLHQVTQAIAGGVAILQLRDKQRSDAELLPIAVALSELCRQQHVLFIINDRIELALQVNADGVHLGRDDRDVQEARALLGNKIIGVSCYGDIARALHFQQQGADYVAFGACFASPTKPHAPVIAPDLLTQAKQQLSIPCCAIGGITLENAPLLLAQGVDMLAIITDLWQKDVATQARQLSSLF